MTGRILKTMCVWTAALCMPGLAYGQGLYWEDFEADPTADWTVNPHPATMITHDFFFDYSSVGIPSAPSSGGTTRGMKLQANLTGDVFGGFSVSPTGLNLEGDYALSFEVWSNYNGPLEFGGSGSTNLSTYGILSSGTSSNYPGAADGVWFATTGDGGSSADWRIYSPDAPASYGNGHPFYTDPTRNHTGATYQVFGGHQAPAAQLALFPQQTGTTRFGTAGFTWHEVVVDKSGDIVTWTMDGTLLATVDITGLTLGGGNILFGHSDINTTCSLDPNATPLLFTLIDNIVVSSVSPCDPCDMDCSGEINAFDIEPFLDLLFGGGEPCCGTRGVPPFTGDVNGDGVIDAFDIEPFMDCLFP